MNRFKELTEQSPDPQSDYTCPFIDAAIEKLEELRAMNTKLRDSATYWQSKCEELCEELDEIEKAKAARRRKRKAKRRKKT
jgi:predicted nuclease with TOPRIM domain